MNLDNKFFNFNYKKSQIGATLTWLVAFIIIFFILVIFIAASSFLAKKTVLLDIFPGIAEKDSADNNKVISDSLIGFFKKEITLDGKEYNFLDLLKEYKTGKREENDIRCFYHKNLEFVEANFGIYTSFYVNGERITSRVIEDCGYKKIVFSFIFPIYSKEDLLNVKIETFVCDVPFSEKDAKAYAPTAYIVKNLEQMREKGLLYEGDCSSVDDKKEVETKP